MLNSSLSMLLLLLSMKRVNRVRVSIRIKFSCCCNFASLQVNLSFTHLKVPFECAVEWIKLDSLCLLEWFLLGTRYSIGEAWSSVCVATSIGAVRLNHAT